MSQRRYGYFECDECDSTWESSHVYCDGFEPVYKQECRSCMSACFPTQVEKLICSVCHSTECTCTEEERKKRNIDASKAHRSDLCLRCRSGRFCSRKY